MGYKFLVFVDDESACELLELALRRLGHSSVRITEKHYSPWVKARQDQLERAVKKAWKH